MSRACVVLLAAALWTACESANLPPPSILAVEPTRVVSGQPVELRLHIDALLPGAMDYGSKSVTGGSLASQVQVWVGAVQVPVERYEAGGILVVSVPASLAVGAHDVRLVLADGRQAMMAQALTVATTHEAEVPAPGAPPPEEAPTSAPVPTEGEAGVLVEPAPFQFDDVAEQVRGVPFTLTLRAPGATAADLRGQVKLSVNPGTITPTEVGPFVDGVLTVRVTLEVPAGPGVIITAEDAQGRRGSSNAFWVRPN